MRNGNLRIGTFHISYFISYYLYYYIIFYLWSFLRSENLELKNRKISYFLLLEEKNRYSRDRGIWNSEFTFLSFPFYIGKLLIWFVKLKGKNHERSYLRNRNLRIGKFHISFYSKRKKSLFEKSYLRNLEFKNRKISFYSKRKNRYSYLRNGKLEFNRNLIRKFHISFYSKRRNRYSRDHGI